MKVEQTVICIDDDWWWISPNGAKERMSPPNPRKDEYCVITHVEPCDWLQYGQGQNFLLSLRGFDRRYSHRHFRVVEEERVAIHSMVAEAQKLKLP